jgi:Leucine-rich repeat (LRR) protein
MDGLVHLEEVMLGDYSVNRLPLSILSLPQMQKISVRRGAPIAKLPSVWPPGIRILKLSAVGASGAFPSFQGSSLLEEVKLDNNFLEGGSATAFNFCPNLRSIDIRNNNLSTEVFAFKGSTNIEFVDMSRNSIHGSIPTDWSSLTSCEVMRASHNLIKQPLAPLQKMEKLELLDLSYNKIAWESSIAEAGDYGNWWIWCPGKATTIDLSHNFLEQTANRDEIGTGEVLLRTVAKRWSSLVRLDLSHVSLKHYPRNRKSQTFFFS